MDFLLQAGCTFVATAIIAAFVYVRWVAGAGYERDDNNNWY